MNGNAIAICQVIPFVKARKMISRSRMMNNDAMYEMKRVMTFSFR